jgi:hypothetical protein
MTMNANTDMTFPRDTKKGATFRCSGRLADPDGFFARVEQVNLDTMSVDATDLSTKKPIKFGLYRSGTGNLLLTYGGLSFGRIEFLSDAGL